MIHVLKPVVIGLLVMGVVGCSKDKDNNPVNAGSGVRLAVISTEGDDEANISVIDFETGTAWNDLLPVSGACEMGQYGDYVYLVDKDGDRVIKFDPEARTALGELSTGAGSAPNSIVFVSAAKAYITLADNPSIMIINPSTMTESGSIDISDMADSDGDPDQDHAVIKDGKLYVALRRSSGRSLSDYSSIAVIDIATDTVAGEIILQTNGIAGASKYSLGGQVRGSQTVAGDIYPYIVSSISYPDDGAIEVLDTAAMTSEVLYSETDIGGNMTIWVFDTPVTGWGIAGLSTTSEGEGWGLTHFNLATGSFEPVSSFQKSVYSWGLDCTDDGLVLVGNEDENNPGVWVFDSKNNYEPVFEQPIDVGLIPSRIFVVR